MKTMFGILFVCLNCSNMIDKIGIMLEFSYCIRPSLLTSNSLLKATTEIFFLTAKGNLHIPCGAIDMPHGRKAADMLQNWEQKQGDTISSSQTKSSLDQ